MFGFLGTIQLGLVHATGPVAQRDLMRNSWARHDVIRGKPVLQEIGRELEERELEFFFDETFCSPPSEWGKLWLAYLAKEPLPFSQGSTFDGMRYVVDALDRETLKTTRIGGIIVRLEARMRLIEAPVPSLLDAAFGAAGAAAAAIGSVVTLPDALK